MKIQFDKPNHLNGEQLLQELASAGIVASNPTIDGDENFWLEIASKDSDAAKIVIASHVEKPIAPLTIIEKLVKLGITAEEAALLLK